MLFHYTITSLIIYLEKCLVTAILMDVRVGEQYSKLFFHKYLIYTGNSYRRKKMCGYNHIHPWQGHVLKQFNQMLVFKQNSINLYLQWAQCQKTKSFKNIENFQTARIMFIRIKDRAFYFTMIFLAFGIGPGDLLF